MLWVFFLDYNLKNELFSSATQLAYHKDVEVYLQINNQSYKKTKKTMRRRNIFRVSTMFVTKYWVVGIVSASRD